MMNDNKISVEQAAPVLGISPNQIRYYMQMNRFDPPIGQVRKVPGSKRHRYDIYKTKVMAYTGITEWPKERRKHEEI